MARHGMVATSQPLASGVGLEILRCGGTAVDAAIGANAALGLMEPTGCGIGGDLFAIVWNESERRLFGLNASGRSPRDMTRARLDELNLAQIPSSGPLSVSVPGAVDGWFELHGRFGRLSMLEILEPAIGYARDGFPVSEIIAGYWAADIERLGAFPGLMEIFAPAGRAPAAGDTFRNPRLAAALELIATEGREVFYAGPIAAQIARSVQAQGGYLSRDDLRAHTSEWVDPVGTNYRGYDVWELPPNGQGIAVLQMLNLLEGYDIGALQWGSAEHLHLLIEAKKLAFEDRARHYADPAFADVPVAALIGKDYAAERRRLIRRDAVLTEPSWGDPYSADTGDPRAIGAGDSRAREVGDRRARDVRDRLDIEADDRRVRDVRDRLDIEADDSRARNVRDRRAIDPGDPRARNVRDTRAIDAGDTVYLATADAAGNMVSLIQSNYRGMGSGVVVRRFGFGLQNRGEAFSLEPGHPNAYAPGKRPFHTIIPGFVTRDGEPFMAFGVMGAAMQPQGQVQVLSNIVDFGMNAQEAGDAPRVRHDGSSEPTGRGETQSQQGEMPGQQGETPGQQVTTPGQRGIAPRLRDDGSSEPSGGRIGGGPASPGGASGRAPSSEPSGGSIGGAGTVCLESGFPAATAAGLERLGHVIGRADAGEGGFGGYQAIMRDSKRKLYLGASESRKDGCAIGY